MDDARRLYLLQKQGETLVELDPESYERLLDSPRAVVVRHRNARPVVKMT
jgi:hypothetical protein